MLVPDETSIERSTVKVAPGVTTTWLVAVFTRSRALATTEYVPAGTLSNSYRPPESVMRKAAATSGGIFERDDYFAGLATLAYLFRMAALEASTVNSELNEPDDLARQITSH